MKATYEELERKIAVLDLQLNLSLAAERAWETTMMLACGEDGPKPVADKFAELEAKCAALASENAVLSKFIDDECYVYGPHDVEPVDAALEKPETPATDAFLAEVRAHGVQMYAMCIAHRVNYSEVDKSNEFDALSFAEGLRNPAPELSPEEVVEFAAQLRQGAAL